MASVRKCAFDLFKKNYLDGDGDEFPFAQWNNNFYSYAKRLACTFSISNVDILSPDDIPAIDESEIKGIIKNDSASLLVFIWGYDKIQTVHDSYKVLAHSNQKRIQFISVETLLSKMNSSMKSEKKDFIEGLAIQILAKCDGIPWKLDKDDERYKLKPGALVIGLGFSRPEEGFLVRGAAHFFDQENSLEKFISKSFVIDEENVKSLYFPTEVLSQIIQEATDWYKSQTNRKVSEIYIFKKSALNHRELFALIKSGLRWTHIFVKRTSTLHRLFDLANKEEDYEYMVERGLALVSLPLAEKMNEVPLTRVDATLTTTGIYWKLYRDGNYYPFGTLGTPRPLNLEIHSNFDADFDSILKLTLALTKVDWENMDLEYREPTVIKFAQRMADLAYAANRLDNPLSLQDVNFDVRDLM